MILVKQNAEQIEVEAREERVAESFDSRTAMSYGPEIDPISQMRANLNQVEDLVGRVRFVMSEVRHIIQKKV